VCEIFFLVEGGWTPLHDPSLFFIFHECGLSFFFFCIPCGHVACLLWVCIFLFLSFFLTCLLSMWHIFFGYASFFLHSPHPWWSFLERIMVVASVLWGGGCGEAPTNLRSWVVLEGQDLILLSGSGREIDDYGRVAWGWQRYGGGAVGLYLSLQRAASALAWNNVAWRRLLW